MCWRTDIVSSAHLEWSKPDDQRLVIEIGQYVARNILPTKMAMWHDGTLYLTMPELWHDEPFTLGAIYYDVPELHRTANSSVRGRPLTDPQFREVEVSQLGGHVHGRGQHPVDAVRGKQLLHNQVYVHPPMVFTINTYANNVSR